MNHSATVLSVMLGACAVIMIEALDIGRFYAFMGGLIVVAISSWLVDKSK